MVSIKRELLEEVLKHVVEAEVVIDSEWGKCRDKEQLIADKALPPLYYKIEKLLKEKSNDEVEGFWGK